MKGCSILSGKVVGMDQVEVSRYNEALRQTCVHEERERPGMVLLTRTKTLDIHVTPVQAIARLSGFSTTSILVNPMNHGSLDISTSTRDYTP